MKIIKADRSQQDIVLQLLDEFRKHVSDLVDPSKNNLSTEARDKGGPVFSAAVASSGSAIFLAEEGGEYIGLATINKIPQIRRGGYCGEIEEMYVIPAYQGQGVATLLLDALSVWAKANGIDVLRLEANNKLTRAHRFYEKSGFGFYGRAYQKQLR